MDIQDAAQGVIVEIHWLADWRRVFRNDMQEVHCQCFQDFWSRFYVGGGKWNLHCDGVVVGHTPIVYALITCKWEVGDEQIEGVAPGMCGAIYVLSEVRPVQYMH